MVDIKIVSEKELETEMELVLTGIVKACLGR